MIRLLVLGVLATLPAWSCSCRSFPTAKEAWQQSAVIFAGRAESVDPPVGQAPPHTVKLRVETPYKGAAAGELITVLQNITSCGGPPSLHTPILFYLFRDEDAGMLRIAQGCSRTSALERAVDDLRFLEGLPGSAQGTRIAGVVWRDSFKTPVPGAQINVTGPDNRATVVLTDANGVYELNGKPPGLYRLELLPPPSFAPRSAVFYGRDSARSSPFLGRELAVTVTVPAGGSAGVDFDLTQNIRVSGTVSDPQGAPLGGVTVDVESTTSNEALFVRERTNADGYFELQFLPRGVYRLVVNPSGRPRAQEPFSRVYYPGVLDKSRATLVTVHERNSPSGLNIRVPALLTVRRITGRVQFADGTALPTGRVNFTGSDAGNEIADVRPDGTFSLPLLEGSRGTLFAEVDLDFATLRDCPHIPRNDYSIKTRAHEITAASDEKLGFVLEFPYASCEAADVEWKRKRTRD